jgi:hypothetical protein
MFAYPEFLETSLKNGLSEITFSLHGHTAKLHDALVGTPGAFEQEVAGLKAALAAPVVVNVDIVINKQNVKHLPVMLDTFYGWGVREFDLLHIIPFGNAWTDARHHLFYDLDDPEIIAALRKAFAYSKMPDVHVWLNRFPPPHTEGFEDLIQDPYKLNDEVRGRREEYDKYLSIGQKLMCRQPERCKYCYLQGLCDTLDTVIEARKSPEVDVLRFENTRPRLGTLPRGQLAEIIARDLAAALPLIEKAEADRVALELGSFAGLAAALEGQTIAGKTLVRVVTADEAALPDLFALPAGIDVVVELHQGTAAALLALPELPERLVISQPTYDRVTEDRARDVDLPAFFARLARPVATENIAPCLAPGARPRPAPARVLDVAMLADDSRIEMTRYTTRYVQEGFRSKSVRCGECIHEASCRGMHINWVRAHGYEPMNPIKG